MAGTVTLTAGLVLITIGMGGHGWWWLLAGGLLVHLFTAIQRRSTRPLVPHGLLRTGPVAAANMLMTLVGAAWFGLFFFLPLYQQQDLGYSPLVSGLTQLPLAAAVVAGSVLAPRLTRRVGERAAVGGAFASLVAGLLWFARTPEGFALAGASLFAGLGLGLAFVLLTDRSLAGVPVEDAGVAGSLINIARQAGGAFGLAVLTAVVQDGRGYAAAFAGAAVLAAVAGAGSLIPAPGRRRPGARG